MDKFSECDLLDLMTSEQRERRQRIIAELARAIPSIDGCAQCESDLRPLRLARLAFTYEFNEFCSGACLEEWLDEKQETA